MKNKASLILAVSAAVLAVFTLGFFTGRNLGSTGIITERIVPVIETVDVSAALETLEPPTTLPPETEPVYPININTADAEALDFLPGIGPTLAQRIVDYREANGEYLLVTDLLNVSGIGKTRLEDILPYITTGLPEEQEETHENTGG